MTEKCKGSQGDRYCVNMKNHCGRVSNYFFIKDINETRNPDEATWRRNYEMQLVLTNSHWDSGSRSAS